MPKPAVFFVTVFSVHKILFQPYWKSIEKYQQVLVFTSDLFTATPTPWLSYKAEFSFEKQATRKPSALPGDFL